MQTEISNEIITRDEVAKILGVSLTQVERFKKAKVLPYIKLARKCVRYRRSDCEKLLADCTFVKNQKKKSDVKNLTKEQLVYNAILSMRPTDVLLLKNVRSFHLLYNAEIDTIAKLITMKRKDILKYRNCGKTTVNEIERELNRFGLELSK